MLITNGLVRTNVFHGLCNRLGQYPFLLDFLILLLTN
jgi:hypothetical protein